MNIENNWPQKPPSKKQIQIIPNNSKQITKILKQNQKKEDDDNNNNSQYENITPEQITTRSEWVGLGDMHGDIDKFINDLSAIWYIQVDNKIKDKSLKDLDPDQILDAITLKNTSSKLIFTWDIMADRNTNGLDIIYILGKLQERPKCDISIIAGNHDAFMISFLLGDQDIELFTTPERQEVMLIKWQAKWLLELTKYLPKELIDKKNITFEDLKANQQTILNNMKNDKQGKQILQTICNLKIIDHYNNSIFLHTPITDHIIARLNSESNKKNSPNKVSGLSRATKRINKNFQNYLKYYLLDQKDIEINKNRFQLHFNTFLHNNNSEPTSRDLMLMWYNLKELSYKHKLKNIIHGHTQKGWKIDKYLSNKKNPITNICNDYKRHSNQISSIWWCKDKLYIPKKMN